MSTTAKYRALVERLFKATQANTIRWTKNQLGEGYTAPVGPRSVVITEGHNFNGEPTIRLILKDEFDLDTESFDDEDITGIKPSIEGYDGYWGLMTELHKTAQRQASGADQTLDSILNDLPE